MKLFEIFGEVRMDGKKASKTLDTMDDKAGKVGGSFKKMAGIIAGAVSVAAIGAMGKKLITLGADAEEMYNKYNVVFDGMADDVTNWADSFAKSRGRSTIETQEMLSNLADLQQGFGFTQDESFEMSKKIVDLGTDLASFNNVNDATAIEAVSKAMMGEGEMAKQLGLALNVNEVKAYAESQGLVYEEMTKGEKMHATYELAVIQSKNAIGDAERSSGSFTNQLKGLTANIKDTATAIGMGLMPMATAAVTFINGKVVPGFMAFAGQVKDVYLEIKERLQPYIELLTAFIVNYWPAMQNKAEVVFKKITLKVAELYEWFKDNLLPIFKEVFEWVVEFWPTFQEMNEKTFDAIIEVVSTLWDWFSTYLLPILVNIFQWVSDNLPVFQAIFEKVFDIISGVVKPLWDIFANFLLPILGDLFGWASEKAMKMADFIVAAFGLVADVVGGVVDMFESLVEWIGKALDKWNEWKDRPEDKTPSAGFSGGASANAGQYTQQVDNITGLMSKLKGQDGGRNMNVNINVKSPYDVNNELRLLDRELGGAVR